MAENFRANKKGGNISSIRIMHSKSFLILTS